MKQGKNKELSEILHLPKENILSESPRYILFFAKKESIPLTFQIMHQDRRQSYGFFLQNKQLLIDEYDTYYDHILLWDKKNNQCVGGYRICIFPHHKTKGYLESRYEFAASFYKDYPCCYELSRSFVSTQYQKSFQALYLLWSGVKAYVVQNSVRHLIGEVTLPGHYSNLTKTAVIRFLRENFYKTHLIESIKPAFPAVIPLTKDEKALLEKINFHKMTFSELNQEIQKFEGDEQMFPVLMKKYLLAGAHVIQESIDPDFEGSLDFLFFFDTRKISEISFLKER